MEYATLTAREASFEPPTKRSKAGWPHKNPSAADLAKAGFYYKPSAASNDNALCFLCDRALDGWEKDDDPVQEHVKHSSDCGWAILMSIASTGSFDPETMDDPTGSIMSQARRATFALGWPHDPKRGWTCKTEKMVEAGWHFAPTTECEDFVSCIYCKLSLDGWEPKDNPFDEHYRRSPDCPFFTFAGTTAPSKRPKATKGRASRASRASRTSKASTRLSTQSNMTLLSEVTSIPDLDESIDTSVGSIMSTTSQAANRGKRKGAGSRSKSTKTKRSKTAQAAKSKEEDTENTGEMLQSPKVDPSTVSQPQPEGEAAGTTVESSQKPRSTAARKQTRRSSSVPAPPASSAHDGSSHPSPVAVGPEVLVRQIASPVPAEPEAIIQAPMSPSRRSPSQPSDVENAPPSTRPASVRPPLSSPGTMVPTWIAVDVDTLFQSTSIADVWDSNEPTSEKEQGMTVQEWIEHIASQAEENLKAEGERAVAAFEREGAKAMTALEAIACV